MTTISLLVEILQMDNFFTGIEYDPFTGSYMACYADGTVIGLDANNYEDAVLEADMIEPHEYSN